MMLVPRKFSDSFRTVILSVAIVLFATGSFAQPSWRTLGSLHFPRHYFGVAAISDSEALVMGGYVNTRSGPLSGDVSASVEIVNVRTRQITPGPAMLVPRAEFATVRLRDSNIVVVSGVTSPDGTRTSECELFDRSSRSWRSIGSLTDARRQHGACLVSDHEILVVAGIDVVNGSSAAEVLDLNSGTSTPVADYPFGCNLPGAGPSSVGHPLFAGGRSGGAGSARTQSAFRYDTVLGTWVSAGQLPVPAAIPVVLSLDDGHLLFIGGSSGETIGSGVAAIAREEADTLRSFATMQTGRVWHSAIEWNADSVLIVGGYAYDNMNTPLSSTEWLDLRSGATAFGPPMATGRKYAGAVRLWDTDCSRNRRWPAAIAISGLVAGDTNAGTVEILEESQGVTGPSLAYDSLTTSTSFDMGATQIGALACRTFAIVNTGPQDVILDTLRLRHSGQFSLAGVVLPARIAAGQRLPVTVCFVPGDTLFARDTVDIIGICYSSSIDVYGRGAGPVCSEDFVADSVGISGVLEIVPTVVFETGCASFLVRNPGSAPIRLDTVWWTRSGEFRVTAPQTPITVPAEATVLFTVCTSPKDSAEALDTLFVVGRCRSVAVPVVVRGILRPPQCGERLEFDAHGVAISPPYPNPALTQVVVSASDTSGKSDQPITLAVRLRDVVGRAVAESVGALTREPALFRLDVSDLPSGVYFLTTAVGHFVRTIPLLIAR